MVLFFWDASALAKRYTAELGSEVVNHLFDDIPRTLFVDNVHVITPAEHN